MRKFIVTGMIASAVLFVTFAVDASSAAQAQRARFCAHYDWSTTNCGFYSKAQCLASINGVGGYCTRHLNGPRVYGAVGGWDMPAPRRYRRYRDWD